MKNLKLALFSLAFSLLFFTSCTNDNEPVNQDQQTTESNSIKTSLNQLRTQFDQNGNFTSENNPVGNIVFDFCFDFVYPLTLSYNNGSTVNVESLDDIVTVLLNSTDQLYINGVSFPFDVEVFNEDTDAIEVVTINNEDEFIDLVEDCDFDSNETCDCDDEDEPVCVEVTSPSGETFIVTFPNDCIAECDGFEEDDFIEDCQDDDDYEEMDCFEFVFPIDIITDEGTTITINSLDELYNAIYGVYDYDLVFPLSITLNNETVITLENEDALEAIIDDCDDDDDDECDYDMVSLENALITSCDTYDIELIDLNDEIANAYIVNFNQNGEIVITGEITVTDIASWSITSSNDQLILNISGSQNFPLLNGSWMLDCDDEELEFYNNDYSMELDCEGNGDGDDDDDDDDDDNEPLECDEDDIIDTLTECEWTATSSIQDIEGTFTFTETTVTVISNTQTISGQWELVSDPQTGEVFMFIYLPTPFDNISSLDWTVVGCGDDSITLESGDESLSFAQNDDCE